MLKTMTFRLRFVLSPLGLVIAALLALVTVLVSAWLPARKAAKQSAIASVRGQNDVAVKLGRSHRISERFVARIFGPEGLLAAENPCAQPPNLPHHRGSARRRRRALRLHRLSLASGWRV